MPAPFSVFTTASVMSGTVDHPVILYAGSSEINAALRMPRNERLSRWLGTSDSPINATIYVGAVGRAAVINRRPIEVVVDAEPAITHMGMAGPRSQVTVNIVFTSGLEVRGYLHLSQRADWRAIITPSDGSWRALTGATVSYDGILLRAGADAIVNLCAVARVELCEE